MEPKETPWVVTLEKSVSIVLATGLVLTVVGAVATPTLGARRSTRLKWESRSGAIEEAIAAESRRQPR